jgi:hypothetical protein
MTPLNYVLGGRQIARLEADSEDLLTERSTLAFPRLGHSAWAKLVRKQQVLGSNPSVGSSVTFEAGPAGRLLCTSPGTAP